jgi:hypothetical protein
MLRADLLIEELWNEMTLRTTVKPTIDHVVTTPTVGDVACRKDPLHEVVVPRPGLRVRFLKLIKGVEANCHVMAIRLIPTRSLRLRFDAPLRV